MAARYIVLALCHMHVHVASIVWRARARAWQGAFPLGRFLHVFPRFNAARIELHAKWCQCLTSTGLPAHQHYSEQLDI